MKSLKLYESLIQGLNTFEVKLIRDYAKEISCKKGCFRCCILSSVCAIEAFIINDHLRNNRITHKPVDGYCPFLADGACSIYEARPVICRTHGYPLLIEGKIDYCDLNFTGIKKIDSGYILDLEAVNTTLMQINAIFLQEITHPDYTEERISMKKIFRSHL